jgi:hypothetical protein
MALINELSILTNDGASDGLFLLKSFPFQIEKNLLLTEFIHSGEFVHSLSSILFELINILDDLISRNVLKGCRCKEIRTFQRAFDYREKDCLQINVNQ